MRTEVGACEHDQINYKTLDKLADQLYKRIVSDEQHFKILAQDILLKNKQIQDFKEINEMLVDKYEDALEAKEKANEELRKVNTQLTLNVEELKTRLFGRFERKLKDFALRPDRKKDN
tara:strand:+ start:247 stop:600 length:354 start_codon:yes stop_codon:yes gene_type:complete